MQFDLHHNYCDHFSKVLKLSNLWLSLHYNMLHRPARLTWDISVHKFIVKSTITTQNDQNHRRTYGYPQNVLFDIVYNTNLIAVVVWSVRHRKPQKYSTC